MKARAPIARLAGLLLAAVLVSVAQAASAGTVRVAVLKFGTVSWELDVIRHHGLDAAEGFELSVLPLAGKTATSVALQAGEVDVVVTDFLWVSRQRAAGADFTFAPYSTMVGAVLVPADSPIRSLSDLAGRRVGIAGGPLDKSWLVIRGFARARLGLGLEDAVDEVFAAPPLVNAQLIDGGVDAAVNFWHYNARLRARGMREVIGVEEAARGLGLEPGVPMLGYVFSERWARSHRHDALGLLRASRRAKAMLAASEQEWERLRPLMRAEDDATFRALIAGFRAGVPARWGAAERRAAARLFDVLAELGGAQLVGPSPTLGPGTFWAEWRF